MYIVDSHCHLNYEGLAHRADEAVENALNNGVRLMQTISTKSHEWNDVKNIAKKYPNVFCSIGVHPHEADKDQVTAAQLLEETKFEKCIGIGETGLDYFYEHSNRIAQKKNFIEHISASRTSNLPTIIHTRDAEEDTYDILKSEKSAGDFPALLHCFTGTEDLARKAMDMGILISISGIVTFKTATELQRVVRDVVPLEMMLVETDAPFLAPLPHRGKKNEPAWTRNTLEFIAQLKGVSPEKVAEKTTQNFFNLFKKAIRV